MYEYYLLIKQLFFIILTIFLVYWFLKDYQKGFYLYLGFFAIFALLSVNMMSYPDKVFFPLLILIGLLIKYNRVSEINYYYLVLYLYMIIITYMNGLIIMDEHTEGNILFGLGILVFSNYLFKNSTKAISTVFFVWLILLGFLINYILLTGNIFSIENINPNERYLTFNTGVLNDSKKSIDLNYFGSGQAIAAVITVVFIYYRRILLSVINIPDFYKKIISSKYFLAILYLLVILEIWMVVRGLSRGSLLVLLSGLIAFLILQRKFSYFLLGGSVLGIGYLIMSKLGFVDLLIQRITNDDTGLSGRNLIWRGIIDSIQSHGGIEQLIFGNGNGWPWWQFWRANDWDRGLTVSTHNQWLSLLIIVGIVGLILFIIPIIKGVSNCLNNRNPINTIRVILFVCVLFESMNLEPFMYASYTFFLFGLVSTYTPNVKILSGNPVTYKNLDLTSFNS